MSTSHRGAGRLLPLVLAMAAIMWLAGCTPPESITPVTTVPADIRGDIAVVAVLPVYADQKGHMT